MDLKKRKEEDLTDSKTAKNVRSLLEGCSTPESAKILGCDDRTIKHFGANSQQNCKKHPSFENNQT